MKLRTCQRFLIFTRKIISQETPSLPQTSPWFIEKVVWRTHTPINILNPVKSSDFDCERSLMICPLLTRARNLLYSKWSSGDGAPSIISYHCPIAKLLQGRLCNQLSAKGGRGPSAWKDSKSASALQGLLQLPTEDPDLEGKVSILQYQSIK